MGWAPPEIVLASGCYRSLARYGRQGASRCELFHRSGLRQSDRVQLLSQLLHNGCIHPMLLLAQLQQFRDPILVSHDSQSLNDTTLFICIQIRALCLKANRVQSFTYYAEGD